MDKGGREGESFECEMGSALYCSLKNSGRKVIKKYVLDSIYENI
jgi:hypothetical protein